MQKEHQQHTSSTPKPLESFLAKSYLMQSNECPEFDYIPAKVTQSVALVLYACSCETPLPCIGSPVFQGLVDLLGGRVQFCSKNVLESYLLFTYKSVCSMLREKC